MDIEKAGTFLIYGYAVLALIFAFVYLPSGIMDMIERFREFRRNSKDKH